MRPQNPVHKLERLDITVTLPVPHNADTTAIAVHGYASTKRAALWHEKDAWLPHETSPALLQPADWLHHVVLASLQDRPNTPAQLRTALTGGLYEDDHPALF